MYEGQALSRACKCAELYQTNKSSPLMLCMCLEYSLNENYLRRPCKIHALPLKSLSDVASLLLLVPSTSLFISSVASEVIWFGCAIWFSMPKGVR